MVSLTVNGKAQSIDTSPDMPLFWVLREKLLLTGTKLGFERARTATPMPCWRAAARSSRPSIKCPSSSTRAWSR